MSKRKQKRLPSTEELYREMIKSVFFPKNKQTSYVCKKKSQTSKNVFPSFIIAW